MIRAILFDLDNTLTDFIKMKQEASVAAASAMVDAGLKMGRKKAAKELLNAYWKYGIDANVAFSKFLREKTGSANRKLKGVAIKAYLKEKKKHLVPYPNVQKTLRELKKRGYGLGILTDAPRSKAMDRLNALGLRRYFDVIITFDETNHQKPHALPFRKAIRKLGVAPEEILMVGDSVERDIVGAKQAGMKACLARYGGSASRKGKADFEIDNVQELLAAL